jgi:hypothetical protein
MTLAALAFQAVTPDLHDLASSNLSHIVSSILADDNATETLPGAEGRIALSVSSSLSSSRPSSSNAHDCDTTPDESCVPTHAARQRLLRRIETDSHRFDLVATRPFDQAVTPDQLGASHRFRSPTALQGKSSPHLVCRLTC